MRRNRIRRLRFKQTIGPWPIGSELVMNDDVYSVVEYERARDGHWVVLLQLGATVPDFWRIIDVVKHIRSAR